MADVDITSLSVEISAESQGAELNIDKLADAIANPRPIPAYQVANPNVGVNCCGCY